MSDDQIKKESCRVAEVWLRSDGILFLEFGDDNVVNLNDRLEIVEVCKRLAGGKKRSLIIRAGDRIKITEEARKYDMNAAVEAFVIREALVINSLSTRISAHFYYKIRKPNFEIKVFATMEQAEKWLKNPSASNHENSETA